MSQQSDRSSRSPKQVFDSGEVLFFSEFEIEAMPEEDDEIEAWVDSVAYEGSGG